MQCKDYAIFPYIINRMAVATNYRIIFVAAVSGIVFVSMETICTRVWPEIRGKLGSVAYLSIASFC